MKTNKLAIFFVCCLAAVSMTFMSCSDDDNNDGSLSKTDYQIAFNAVRGDYTGKVYYPVPNDKTGKYDTDSANVSWSIQKDSAMTIRNFPVAALGANVTDKDAREAIMKEAPQNISCRIIFSHVSPTFFAIYPSSVDLNLNYGDKDHKLKIAFYVSPYISYGQQNAKSGPLYMQIVEGGVYEDGVLHSSWVTQGIPFQFVSSSKL